MPVGGAHAAEAASADCPEPLPVVSDPQKYGIALIGAGHIVCSAHLPAYRKAGFRVEGIFDIDRKRAQRVAGDFHVQKVYPTLDGLLADPEVQVVDVAVPPWAQEELVAPIARSGRHLLCQKPLAVSSGSARQVVAAAREAGVQLAVNVNTRFAPAVRYLKQMLLRGQFGQLRHADIRINYWDDWKTWPWLKDLDELVIRYDAIHVMDVMRYLLGEAESIYAAAGPVSGLQVRGETNVILVFRYASGPTAYIRDSADNWARDTCAEFRIEGDQAVAKGILGIWYDYPVGRPDRVESCTRERPGEWHVVEPPGMWAPDAWIWTMAELFDAIENVREPIHGGADHIRTLRYVEAAYRSIRTGQAVSLRDFTPEGA